MKSLSEGDLNEVVAPRSFGSRRRSPKNLTGSSARILSKLWLSALLLATAGCSPYPTIRPGDSAAGHDFALDEDQRGVIRKIDVWFQPGRVLQWELVRSEDASRSTIPLDVLDYGQVPPAMDQAFPGGGRPEPIREGQVILIALEYDPPGAVDPLAPGVVTRWYRRDARGFREVSEMEETNPRKDRARDQAEKR